MSFDDIPEDRQESFECEVCGGNVAETEDGIWSCDSCDNTYLETELGFAREGKS